MKNVIIASVVASIAASSAFATNATTKPAPATAPVTAEFGTDTVIWEGTAANLPDGCVFTKNVDGKMTYAENTADSGGVWTVTQKAVLEVSVRGRLTSLKVEADSDIERVGGSDADDLTSNGHSAYAVTVDYAAGSMPTVIDRSVRNYDSGPLVDDREDTTTWATYKAGKIEMGSFNVGKHNRIELGGTATMNYSGALIDNGDYELGHTATCLQ